MATVMTRIVAVAVIALAVAFLIQLVEPATERAAETPDAYAAARALMVEEQLRPSGITDARVLEAMGRTPRHAFVPERLRDRAYEDTPLPIGEGQTISQPLMVAIMTQALELRGREKVLEIGTGSGYQAAVLAALVPHVYTIEIVPTLARRAEQALVSAGYRNVHVRTGDGYLGWPEEAPFDAIMVTAAPDHVPQPLIDQLAADGRLVLPVGPEGGLQVLRVVEKRGGRVSTRDIDLVRFVPLVREASPSP